MKKDAKEGKFDYACLVSMFTDCIGISNALAPVDIEQHIGPQTTDFDKKWLVTKKNLTYKLQNKIEYEDKFNKSRSEF